MATTLTKADLMLQLQQRPELGITKLEAITVIDTFFEQLSQSLMTETLVKLPGFGNFQLREKNQRPGRDFKTGQTVTIKARRAITFRAGRKLQEQIEKMLTEPCQL